MLPRIVAARLAGGVLGAAVLTCAAIAANAARATLSGLNPTHHTVPRTARDAWFDAARDLDLRTPQGIVVRGWLRPSTNGAAVLFVHGTAADRRQLLPEAHTLSAAGYGVLVFDRPGDGESGGRAVGGAEADFLRVTLDALATEPTVKAIGAFGFSSGAAMLAEAAARDTRIRGVVLAGCIADADYYAVHFRGRGPLTGWPSLWAARWAGVALPQPLVLVPRIAPRAVFLIAGEDDDIVPAEMTRQVYAAAPPPKDLWVISGAGHGNYARVAGEEYGHRLIAFFDRALLERGRAP
jgi:pimeloyl-ACP methyl ester carboxylesterase